MTNSRDRGSTWATASLAVSISIVMLVLLGLFAPMAHCRTISFQGLAISQQLSNWREAEDVSVNRVLKRIVRQDTERSETEMDEQPARRESKGRYETIDKEKIKPAPVCE